MRSTLPIAALLLAGAAHAQDVADRIVGAALNRRGAITFLEALTDTVGGRVTGSPESRAASELVLRTLREAGFANARFEEYSFAPGWKRGPAAARVISPAQAPLHVGSYGWAPGIRMDVPLAIAVATPDGKISPDPSRLRGAAVLVSIESGADLTLAPNYVVMRSRTAQKLATAGAAAMLIPSEKPGRMLYTSAAGLYPRAPLPILSVAKEDALLLRRLLSRGEVKLALDVQNRFDDRPPSERNVVADVPGTDPRAVVLVGAHFDSWDPAQGATDNGAGVAAVLDAARILRSLGVKPRATLRFVFFSGEEQACLGSRAWAEAHAQELDHLWAALIMDGEPQSPLGFLLHGRDDRRLAPGAPCAARRPGRELDRSRRRSRFRRPDLRRPGRADSEPEGGGVGCGRSPPHRRRHVRQGGSALARPRHRGAGARGLVAGDRRAAAGTEAVDRRGGETAPANAAVGIRRPGLSDSATPPVTRS
jgi:hypothetical protein